MNKKIAIFFAVVLSGLEISALNASSHYKYDILMCLFLLLFVYRLRNAILLLSAHYLMLSIFLVVHCLGLYGYYESYPLGIEYDYWVHLYFGLVSSLMIFHWFENSSYEFHKVACYLGSMMFVLGMSSAHELYEFMGAILLGKGEGVLFIGAGDLDPWDTQKDMLNNLIGAVIGMVVYPIFPKNNGSDM